MCAASNVVMMLKRKRMASSWLCCLCRGPYRPLYRLFFFRPNQASLLYSKTNKQASKQANNINTMGLSLHGRGFFYFTVARPKKNCCSCRQPFCCVLRAISFFFFFCILPFTHYYYQCMWIVTRCVCTVPVRLLVGTLGCF
jgi:hypothetical protein